MSDPVTIYAKKRKYRPPFRRRVRFAKWAIRRGWYRARYGVSCKGPNGTMLPTLGAGQYVDVIQRGPFLDIHDHRENGTIRLVPYQPNHGVMVEFWLDGKMRWRSHLDYRMLRGFGMSERGTELHDATQRQHRQSLQAAIAPADAHAATVGQSSTDNERGSASTEKAPSVSPARSDR